MLEGVTPAGSLRLVEALQKANKDFDMLLLPNFFTEPTGYTTRREWDYLVTHLQQAKPPKNVQLKGVADDLLDVIDENAQ